MLEPRFVFWRRYKGEAERRQAGNDRPVSNRFRWFSLSTYSFLFTSVCFYGRWQWAPRASMKPTSPTHGLLPAGYGAGINLKKVLFQSTSSIALILGCVKVSSWLSLVGHQLPRTYLTRSLSRRLAFWACVNMRTLPFAGRAQVVLSQRPRSIIPFLIACLLLAYTAARSTQRCQTVTSSQ